MAQPAVPKFVDGIFFLGDGASPTEGFPRVCGFTQWTVNPQTETAETVIPDCDAPDSAVWVSRDAVSHSMTISFSGVAAVTTVTAIEAAQLSGKSRNVRFRIVGAGSGGGTPDKQYSGRFHLSVSQSAERGQRAQIEVECMSDGPVTITSVAALP